MTSWVSKDIIIPFITIIILLTSGCTTITDLQTVSLLNQRISSLENKKPVEEADDPTELKGETPTVKVLYVPKPKTTEDTVIWITISNGGMLPVRFYIENGVWVGPLGDHYFHRPTKKQVEVLYKR